MKFRTELLATGANTTGIELTPAQVEELGGGKRPAVNVGINGFAYRSSVGSMGGRFLVPVSAERRAAAGVKAGDTVEVDLTLDTAPRELAVPADLADARADIGAFTGSLYRLLSQRGHDIDHARAVLSPVVADAELAEILGVAPGTPLQHLKQVDHDTAGRPVMHSLEWHVPSVIELRVYRRGPGRVDS